MAVIPHYNMKSKLQRDPNTLKLSRNSETGKLIRTAACDCAYGDDGDCFDADNTPDEIILHVTGTDNDDLNTYWCIPQDATFPNRYIGTRLVGDIEIAFNWWFHCTNEDVYCKIQEVVSERIYINVVYGADGCGKIAWLEPIKVYVFNPCP